MSDIGYKFEKELGDRTRRFHYGNKEEQIDFVADNYYDAMKLYRQMLKNTAEAEIKKRQAHETLQELREMEEIWRKKKIKLNKEQKEEHTKRKQYYTNVRDEKIPVVYNQLSYYINTHMNLFRIMDQLDRIVRRTFGKLCRMIIWPTRNIIKLGIYYSSDEVEVTKLVKNSDYLDSISTAIENKIVIP